MKTATFILLFVCSTLIGFSQTANESISANFDEAKEKKAVLEAIVTETELAFKGDLEAVKKYYIHSDYTFQAYNFPDGTFGATVGWTPINEGIDNYMRQNPEPDGISNHPKVERRNMVWKFFNSELAFVIWDQYNSDQELKMFHHSKETRIMEKQNGSWKIVNMTALWDYKNLVPADSIKLISEK